jgi:hypothetical protein
MLCVVFYASVSCCYAPGRARRKAAARQTPAEEVGWAMRSEASHSVIVIGVLPKRDVQHVAPLLPARELYIPAHMLHTHTHICQSSWKCVSFFIFIMCVSPHFTFCLAGTARFEKGTSVMIRLLCMCMSDFVYDRRLYCTCIHPWISMNCETWWSLLSFLLCSLLFYE